MKKTTALKAFLIAVLHFAFYILHFTAQGAVIQQVIVRQQWPWSTDIKVEYKLAEVTTPVDISVKAFNGETDITTPNLVAAITGDLYGISESGIGQFIIDPVKAFGNQKVAIADFRVELEVSESPANMSEVLYKIYDLEGGDCTDVTRADLLNGKYGTIETDYTKLGSGFTTPLTDVLIWTGVTNDAKYATTHLVMRKIPAKNQTFAMGSPDDEYARVDTDTAKVNGSNVTVYGRETQHNVTMTNDFYMGVFEVKQYQYWKITGSWPSRYSLAECRNMRPVELVSYDNIRGGPKTAGGTWPTNLTHEVDSNSFLGKLREALYGAPKLDLPTEAQWEYACRAKSTTMYYNGKSCSNGSTTYNDVGLSPIARYVANGGYLNGAAISAAIAPTLGTTNGTARVGSYMPNAWGLYDMLGNVQEWCLDWYAMFTSDAQTEPPGPAATDAFVSKDGYNQRSVRGGGFATAAAQSRAARRDRDTWPMTDSSRGFRLCLTVME